MNRKLWANEEKVAIVMEILPDIAAVPVSATSYQIKVQGLFRKAQLRKFELQ